MKICLFNVTSTIDVIGSTEVGGVEAYVFRLGEALQKRGHQVAVFSGAPKKGRSHHLTSLPLTLFPHLDTNSIPHFGTRFRRLIQRLHFGYVSRKAVLSSPWDAVIIFKPYDFTTAWNWRRLGLQARIIASIHGPEFYATDTFFSKSVDGLYAVSPGTAEKVTRHYHRPCPVLPNFLSLEEYPFQELKKPSAEKRILSVGRLVGWKGLVSLIEAFARVHRENPDARLCIAGDGPQKTQLQELVSDLRLARLVEFAGILSAESIRAEHARASLFVQPSIGYESFSISTLEALASGVRTLVSTQVGIADWFSNRETLPIYPAGNELELAAQIGTLLREPWEQQQLRVREARKIVETEFSATRVVAEIEKLCKAPGDPVKS